MTCTGGRLCFHTAPFQTCFQTSWTTASPWSSLYTPRAYWLSIGPCRWRRSLSAYRPGSPCAPLSNFTTGLTCPSPSTLLTVASVCESTAPKFTARNSRAAVRAAAAELPVTCRYPRQGTSPLGWNRESSRYGIFESITLAIILPHEEAVLPSRKLT